MKRPTAPQVVVGLLIVAYIAIFGTMSLRRHQNLRTNALDLGYTDQAVWNTLQGRPFRFSTYVDAAFKLDIPIQDFREPELLLGYHVEPILAAIAPLYLLHDGPETLLWLQTIAIALGAIPVYLIVRHRIEWRAKRDKGQERGNKAQGASETERTTPSDSRFEFQIERWVPVGFVLLYLLSPSLQAANLSDFHAVALSPLFLLSAFYFLETDRPWGFVIFSFLAMMCKEEIGLLVALMGLWAAFVRRRWLLGLAVAILGAGWTLLSMQVIMPHFSGLSGSAFLVRYGQFGDSPVGIVRNLVQQPELFVTWLRRPDVLRYLRDLWLSSGGLAVLHPLSLVMAAPSVALNTFSSYGWMRSGGGHYSAPIVPFLVIAAAYGVDWVASVAGKRGSGKWPVYHVVSLVLVSAGLVVAMVHSYNSGISPLSRRFSLEAVTEHARRAEPFIEYVNGLPPEVPISVGSNLYPHVAHRERVYLFPTISDAQVILLDLTGPASPVGAGDQAQVVRELLDYGEFGVKESDHGLLLLERNLDSYEFAPSFYDAFLAGESTPQIRVDANFDGKLRLEGFDWVVRPVVRPEVVVEISTYWRALLPLDEEYRAVFHFWDEDGHLQRVQPEERVMHWYPTWQWEPDEVVKMTLPPLPIGDVARVGVAVLLPGADENDVEGRLVPITSATGEPLRLWEQDTILELIRP